MKNLILLASILFFGFTSCKHDQPKNEIARAEATMNPESSELFTKAMGEIFA